MIKVELSSYAAGEEQRAFTGLSQVDLCQHSQESSGSHSDESSDGRETWQLSGIDSDYNTMESSKSVTYPSTSAMPSKHQRSKRGDKIHVKVISPMSGLMLNMPRTHYESQKQTQARSDQSRIGANAADFAVQRSHLGETRNILCNNAGQSSEINSCEYVDTLNIADDVVVSTYECFKKRYYIECVEYLSLSPLLPYLVEGGLVTSSENEYLRNANTSEKERKQHLLNSILPKKGPDVLECFKDCVRKEREHKGHIYLTDVFNQQNS